MRVGVTAEPDRVVIGVRDDGAGLPPELAAAPFEPGRHPSRKSSGAGLGLSIAKGIVQAHGGVIELVPQPAGTCFRVSLPVEAELPDPSRAPHDPKGSDD